MLAVRKLAGATAKSYGEKVVYEAALTHAHLDVLFQPQFEPEKLNRNKKSGKAGLPGSVKGISAYIPHGQYIGLF
ncbi:hypothetical protein HDV05_004869 [Chytridiales sp. JEL 0842]|nr:hypothetical protein HDV05_004869 [Chytridiales sp. JEL 0842]